MPTMVSHGTIYSFEKDMLLADEDRWSAQLVPENAPVRSIRLASANVQSLTGNAMNVSSIGSVMLYCLSNLIRRDAMPFYKHVISADDDDHDSLEGDGPAASASSDPHGSTTVSG